MPTPNDAVSAGSSLANETPGLPSTEITDDLINELDSLDDPERASADPIAAESASSESPAAAEPTPKTASPSDAPTAAADSPTPDAPSPEIAELLKAATPLSFTVDGQTKTFDGIMEIKGEGALIDAKSLERVRDTLGLAEKAIQDNRGLYERVQSYERLGGAQKFEELASQVAMLDAAGSKLLSILEDPTQLLMLDEQGQVVKNQRAIDLLTRDLMLSSKEAGWKAREDLRQSATQYTQSTAQQQQQVTALDKVVQQLGAQYPALTPQDLAAARAHFATFANVLFRPATPQDAQQYGYRIGELLLDVPKMTPWFEDRAQLRSGYATASTARRAAEAENRTRMPAPPPPVNKRSAAVAQQPRAKDGTFAEKELAKEAQRSAMRRAHTRGEFFATAQTDDT